MRYGGPIYSVHALARALARRGNEVHVYTTNIDGESVSPVPLREPVDIDGVQVWYFSTGFGRRLYRSPAMGRALRANLQDFDVLHLHSVFLWPTTVAARMARHYNVPYILSPRGMLVPDLIRRKSAFAKRLWIALFERRNIAGAAAIHFTSQIEAEDFKAIGLKLNDAVIVPNGIDIVEVETQIRHEDEATRRTRPYLLSLGRISWKKRLDCLIRAVAQVPDIDLVIAGNDDEGLQPTLAQLAHQVGIADRVTFVGPVEGARKWLLFREAQIFVLPSYSENFGIAALEAMAAGCPVIVTPGVGISTAVSEARAGLVTEADPSALANAINALLADADLRKRMGEAGHQAALQSFSWDAIAMQIESVYRRHCTTAGAGNPGLGRFQSTAQ